MLRPAPAVLASLSALVLAGCARSPETSLESAPRTETVRFDHDTGVQTLDVLAERSTFTDTLVRDASDVWPRLPIAFGEVGLSVDLLDPARRMIGTRSMRVRRTLGGVPLSRYFDCGSSMSGPNTASYTLRISVLTAVDSLEAGVATLRTSVSASAAPEGVSAAPTRCSSSGALERRIRDLAVH